MKEKNMKRIEGISELTAEEKAQMNALSGLSDSEIDTSETPEWTEQDFANAMRLEGRSMAEAMKLYKTRKAPVTARIDLDVLVWLKAQGEGYQTRMNAILRAAMLQDLRRSHRPHQH